MESLNDKRELYQKILEYCDEHYGVKHDIPWTIVYMACDELDIDRDDVSFDEICEMFDVNIG